MFQKIISRYRYSAILLRQLVITDFKLRYQGSALGYIWSLLRPLALFLILYLVFAKVFRLGGAIPHYPVYLLVGIVVWNYFSEVTTGSVTAIVGKGDLLRKINFPKYVIVLAGSFAALINLALNSVIILLFMIINGVEIHFSVIYLPLLVLELFVFSLAIAFFLSTAFVRFRDINYIWEVVMQAAFYATPILYPVAFVISQSPLMAKILMLNPMAQIIQDIRQILVTPESTTIAEAYGTSLARIVPVGIVCLSAILAVLYFRNRSKLFAEEI